jgi:cell division protease FtsH
MKLVEPVEDIMRWSEEKKFTMIWNALKSDKVYEGDSYSKLLIFVSGNLDEAYDMADQTGNADHDADVFHDFSSKINIVDIKNALNKRFKPEQISRLGNVHVIYPSLSKKSYQTIIVRKVAEMTRDIKKKHGVKVTVDKSVKECIYRNGVFPAQGVRPVFSSVSSLLGSSIPTFIMASIERKKTEFSVSYENDHIVALIGGKTYKYKIECSIDKIKEENNQDEVALTSVHEAGHAIVYASLFGISPTQIVSSMSSSDNGGFIGLHQITNSQRDAHNKIVVMMAGKVSEELVFGEDHATSGAQGDITKASKLASYYFRDWGMGEPNAKISNQFSEHAPPANYDMSNTNESIEKLITRCKNEAKEVIKDNLEFFTATIDKLVNGGEVKPEAFKVLAHKHGLEIDIVPPKESVLSKYSRKLEEFKSRDFSSPREKNSMSHSRNTEKIKLAASKKRNK